MKPQKRSILIHNSLFIKAALSFLLLSGILVIENKPVFLPTSGSKAQLTKQPLTIIPQEEPSPTIAHKIIAPSPQTNIVQTTDQWGISKQIGEHTYTIKVGMDTKMATAQEIFQAINSYRQVQGKSTLAWDDTLASYASTRTIYFQQLGKLDAHAGFNSYLTQEDGFKKLGYYSLGENSSIGYKLQAVHLIEWVYASDAPHNENQLNSTWTHVGVSVSGTATDIIFAAHHM